MTSGMVPRRYGGVTAFDPSDIAGLQVWLKADALALSDNDPVASWTDSSGNGRTLTSATGQTYQTNEQNSLPIVRFDGTDDLMDNGSAIALKHIFVVLKITQATFADYDGVLTGPAFLSGDNEVVLVGDGAGGTQTKFYDAAQTTLYRLDGADLAEGSMTAPMNVYGVISLSCAAGWSLAGLRVGKDRDSGGRFLPADIGELLGYDSVLSSTDRDAVEAYLADKWGL
jgi:hypothetical protein